MSMIEVERALEHVAAAEEAAEAAGPDAVEGDAEAREQQGQFAYRLAVVRPLPLLCVAVLRWCAPSCMYVFSLRA